MARCLHLTLFWGFCLGFALGFPSLDCPESSSSRWCEVHSNQQKWPQMVSSSPRVDGWTVGKFALSTKKGLQGPDAICGQDVGGTQWYFQAPKKLLASSWLPYNGRIMWQLGVPIWETQTAASSSDDIIIRCVEGTTKQWTEIVGVGAYSKSIAMQRGNVFNSLTSIFSMDLHETNFVFKESRNKVPPSFFRRCLSRATNIGINGGLTKQGEITCLQYVWIVSEGPIQAPAAWPQMELESIPDKVTCANKSNTDSGAKERPAVSPWLQTNDVGDFVTILSANLVQAKQMVNLTFATPSPLCWDAELMVKLSKPPNFLRKIEVFDQGGRSLGRFFDSQHLDPTVDDTLWVPSSSVAASVTGFVTFTLKSAIIFNNPNSPGERGNLDFTVESAELRIKRTPCVSRITRTSIGNIPVTGRLSLPPMSPHLTCQTDVQPATIGIRIYRQVLENRQGGGKNSQSWMEKNFSTVTLKLGSHSQTVSVRSLAMIAGETTQQQYIESNQVAYSMMAAGFLSTSLSGLYSFCVQGDRELPNICQLPVSVSWSPSDIIIHSVEFVLSAAIRPSCMQSSFLNSPTPEMPLKMFDKGIIDYDDSFLRVPIPSVPPVGAHMFAQFHIKASVKSANIQVVCGSSAVPVRLGFLLGSHFRLPMQWQLPLVYPLSSSYLFPSVLERREISVRLDITVTRTIRSRCFVQDNESAFLSLRLETTKHDAATAAALPNNLGEKISGLTNDAMVGGISIFWMEPSLYFTANVDNNPLEYAAVLIPLLTKQW